MYQSSCKSALETTRTVQGHYQEVAPHTTTGEKTLETLQNESPNNNYYESVPIPAAMPSVGAPGSDNPDIGVPDNGNGGVGSGQISSIANIFPSETSLDFETVPTISSALPNEPKSTPTASSSENNEFPGVALAGIIVGIILLLALLVLGLMKLTTRAKKDVVDSEKVEKKIIPPSEAAQIFPGRTGSSN